MGPMSLHRPASSAVRLCAGMCNNAGDSSPVSRSPVDIRDAGDKSRKCAGYNLPVLELRATLRLWTNVDCVNLEKVN